MDELVSLLMRLNLKRPVASTLICMMDGKEYSSHEIERMSGLRQPEVSVSMKYLLGKKWITQREVKKVNEKGRPVKRYKLKISMDDIITSIEKSILEENQKTLDSIKELKEFA
ncbi:MAG: transcriptional regulator [Methanosarcinaceae archaeon]|nr:transcriptional regulator [Methanosarcinaceae archaeon]